MATLTLRHPEMVVLDSPMGGSDTAYVVYKDTETGRVGPGCYKVRGRITAMANMPPEVTRRLAASEDQEL